jgi:hypothetical protein
VGLIGHEAQGKLGHPTAPLPHGQERRHQVGPGGVGGVGDGRYERNGRVMQGCERGGDQQAQQVGQGHGGGGTA